MKLRSDDTVREYKLRKGVATCNLPMWKGKMRYRYDQITQTKHRHLLENLRLHCCTFIQCLIHSEVATDTCTAVFCFVFYRVEMKLLQRDIWPSPQPYQCFIGHFLQQTRVPLEFRGTLPSLEPRTEKKKKKKKNGTNFEKWNCSLKLLIWIMLAHKVDTIRV